jgi:hypothetical protein
MHYAIFLMSIFFYFPQLCGVGKPYLSPEKLRMKHEAIKTASLEKFRSKRKMGGSQISQPYEDKLIEKIKEAYKLFIKRNNSKHNNNNMLYAYGVPVAVAALALLSFAITGRV